MLHKLIGLFYGIVSTCSIFGINIISLIDFFWYYTSFKDTDHKIKKILMDDSLLPLEKKKKKVDEDHPLLVI